MACRKSAAPGAWSTSALAQSATKRITQWQFFIYFDDEDRQTLQTVHTAPIGFGYGEVDHPDTQEPGFSRWLLELIGEAITYC